MTKNNALRPVRVTPFWMERNEETNTWERKDGTPRDGKFHGWGCSYDELDNGVGTFTLAIVEFADGTVELVNLDQIRFLDSGASRI